MRNIKRDSEKKRYERDGDAVIERDAERERDADGKRDRKKKRNKRRGNKIK
jgi:hypothetical protein